MIGYEYENIINDLVTRGTYKDNIGRWIAGIGDDYVIADTEEEACQAIRKHHKNVEHFLFKIAQPNTDVVLIAAA